MVDKQISIAKRGLHVRDGVDRRVHNPLRVLNCADQGRQASHDAVPRLNRYAHRVLVQVLVHLNLLLQLLQIAGVGVLTKSIETLLYPLAGSLLLKPQHFLEQVVLEE